MNYFVSDKVKPDGTTMGLGAAGQVDPLQFRSAASRYDAATLHYVGGVDRGANVLLIGTDALARIKDPNAKPIIMGAIDGSRTGMMMAMWGREFAGWNLRWVIGYRGTPALMLALQRGEINMTATANTTMIMDLLKEGKHALWVQAGSFDDGKFVPRPEFKNTPVLYDLIGPHLKTELQRRAFAYWEGTSAVDKFLVLPPTAPDAVVKVYRDAFRMVAKDPGFIEQGKKTISKEFSVVSPEDQEKMALQIATADQSTIQYIDSIRVKQGLPSMLKKKKKKKKKK